MNVLENLLSQATSPSSQHYNSDTLKIIVELINKDPNGPCIALRLLAHKIQSPQEREALCALILLEGLTKQCDRPFISELGKFKFLNEIIKVLSPKYLGEQTAESVKSKCKKLLFEWQRDYGTTEPKFLEAYNMLCNQGIITPDAMQAPNGQRTEHASAGAASRRINIFDRNRHSSRLTKLLRSRNPNDIAEANRIIKSIVEEDQQRLEKVTQRTTEMESLKNNALLLNEMTSNYVRSGASEAELELMNELVENIRKARPLLYSFSLTHDEQDVETLAEIAQICEQATNALDYYEDKVKKSGKTTSNVTPRPLVSESQPMIDTDATVTTTTTTATDAVTDLLSKDLFELGLTESADSTPAASIQPSIGVVPDNFEAPQKTQSSHDKYDELADIFSNLPVATVPASTASVALIPSGSTPATGNRGAQSIAQPCYQASMFHSPTITSASLQTNPAKTKLFDDLDSLGRQMLGLDSLAVHSDRSKTIDSSHVQSSPGRPSVARDCSATMNGVAGPSTTTDVASQPPPPPLMGTQQSPSHPVVDLSALDVQLSAIEPHPTIREPQLLYPNQPDTADCDGVRLALHYAANRPAPDVSVFVAVVTSRSPLPVTDLLMRFAVNKPLHLRQLTASGQSLSAYSPFLPTGAVNQVILIFDPVHKPTFNLKFQLSFNLGDEAILESGSATVPGA